MTTGAHATGARPDGFRGIFRDDASARAVYAEAAGIGRAMPAAVAVPADADDVAALVRWAHRTRTALVPRGSGSSMAGGAIGRGVIVDLSRLDSIGAIAATASRMWIGPGALRGQVRRAAAAQGLRFPPDPSSSEYCTVGGMASTNAAGAHTLRYGSTRAWIAALDCVFDDGSRATVRRGEPAPLHVPAIARFVDEAHGAIERAEWESPAEHAAVRKDSSGYALAAYARSGDLVDLLVGSEGTLALFVGLELALAPLPGATSSLLASFASLEDAVRGARSASAAAASACELLDRTFLDVAAEGASAPSLPAGTEAVLLAEVEGDDAQSAASSARTLERAFLAAGATRVSLALQPAEEHALWELRHAASPILAALDPALKSMQFIEDGAVPPAKLPDYIRGIRAALARHDVRGVIFGHAGDAHMHVNPLVDVRRSDWRAQVEALLDEVAALTASLGGTLTGEHGDGRLRTPLLARMWPEPTRELFALVKRCFDPAGILNPGVKVPLVGQRPLDEIKYDPALAPLPSDARRALDFVSEERAYGRFRLALLDGAH